MTSPANVLVVTDSGGKERTGYVALVNEDGTPWSPDSGGGSVAWDDIEGVPASLTSAQAAGTASVRAIGTGATQAAAGNHSHAFTALTGEVDGAAGANLQAILEDFAERIGTLENPA